MKWIPSVNKRENHKKCRKIILRFNIQIMITLFGLYYVTVSGLLSLLYEILKNKWALFDVSCVCVCSSCSIEVMKRFAKIIILYSNFVKFAKFLVKNILISRISFEISGWSLAFWLHCVPFNSIYAIQPKMKMSCSKKSSPFQKLCSTNKYVRNFCVYEIVFPFMHVMFTIINKNASSQKLERHGCISYRTVELCEKNKQKPHMRL